MKQIALIFVIMFSMPALACERKGLVEVDCPTKTISRNPVNANDRMKGAVDPSQWDRWNAHSDQFDAAAAQKRQEKIDSEEAKARNKESEVRSEWDKSAAGLNRARTR